MICVWLCAQSVFVSEEGRIKCAHICEYVVVCVFVCVCALRDFVRVEGAWAESSVHIFVSVYLCVCACVPARIYAHMRVNMVTHGDGWRRYFMNVSTKQVQWAVPFGWQVSPPIPLPTPLTPSQEHTHAHIHVPQNLVPEIEILLPPSQDLGGQPL